MEVPAISPYLGAILLAWAVAQGTKYLIGVFKAGSFTTHADLLYQSGSMPSVHSAVMVAVTTMIGIREGIDTAIFALTLVVTVVILYDALQVRRAVGEQGLALRTLLTKEKMAVSPHQALGHKPLEVVAGIVIGLCVAFFITHFLQ